MKMSQRVRVSAGLRCEVLYYYTGVSEEKYEGIPGYSIRRTMDERKRRRRRERFMIVSGYYPMEIVVECIPED